MDEPKIYIVVKPFHVGKAKFTPGDKIESPESWIVEGRFVEPINENETLLTDDSSNVSTN